MKGYDSTIGLIARCGHPKRQDALAVELLRDAGAIVFAKTTNPQSCMAFETDSNVFGKSEKCGGPHDRMRQVEEQQTR